MIVDISGNITCSVTTLFEIEILFRITILMRIFIFVSRSIKLKLYIIILFSDRSFVTGRGVYKMGKSQDQNLLPMPSQHTVNSCVPPTPPIVVETFSAPKILIKCPPSPPDSHCIPPPPIIIDRSLMYSSGTYPTLGVVCICFKLKVTLLVVVVYQTRLSVALTLKLNVASCVLQTDSRQPTIWRYWRYFNTDNPSVKRILIIGLLSETLLPFLTTLSY